MTSPTYVSFLWHMHQPYYRDPVRGEYAMPWAYLHGTKDYWGMAALVREFPDVHQVINLVPSLILQLEDYARGTARDLSFDLAFKTATDLSMAERNFIVDYFFQCNFKTMISPYPRYLELCHKRGAGPHDRARVVAFSDQEILDLQVWWSLVWIDRERRPKELIRKGAGFTESDKAQIKSLALEILNDIVPTHRELQEKGSLEISTTPFNHPILPLLIDSRVDDPDVPVAVRIPKDAREQLRRAYNCIRERFGQGPSGLWPSEGSVSKDVVTLAGECGFRWMATDEGILAKSGVNIAGAHRHRVHKPYRLGNVTLFFRDRNLSDLIGFQYQHWSARDAATDLLAHLRRIPPGSQVTIAVDGENPWEHFSGDGRDFLRYLYEGIQNEPQLQAVTLSEAMARQPAEPLESIAPGSWIHSDFAIWIGHPEDHEAWRWILRAREALMSRQGSVPDGDWNLAYDELLIAEGSDWMWWFGSEFSTPNDALFDDLFRRHIGNVFRLVGLEPPKELIKPIKGSR